MKLNREGKATIISREHYHKISNNFKSETHRLLFHIAMLTGERWGAICQLKVENVYQDPLNRIPKTHIFYPAEIRKASRDGKRYSRQVKVSPQLETFLKAYQPPLDPKYGGWLFPSPICMGKPITRRGADRCLREALKKASLDHLGISTHSTRRTFITNLHKQGASIAELKAITGHRSTQALLQYIEVDSQRIENLVDNIPVAFA